MLVGQLIGHNTQLIPFAVEAEHGEGKVFAHGADHPAGAQDQAPSSCSKSSGHGFSCSFAGAVNTERVAGLLRLIGRALGSVEDEVGADLERASPC